MVLTGVIFVVVVCQKHIHANQMVNMMVKNEYSVKTKQKYKDKNKAEKKERYNTDIGTNTQEHLWRNKTDG